MFKAFLKRVSDAFSSLRPAKTAPSFVEMHESESEVFAAQSVTDVENYVLDRPVAAPAPAAPAPAAPAPAAANVELPPIPLHTEKEVDVDTPPIPKRKGVTLTYKPTSAPYPVESLLVLRVELPIVQDLPEPQQLDDTAKDTNTQHLAEDHSEAKQDASPVDSPELSDLVPPQQD